MREGKRERERKRISIDKQRERKRERERKRCCKIKDDNIAYVIKTFIKNTNSKS